MVEFRRGFKTEAIEIAGEVRKELGLRPLDPLDPWRLAGHLAVPLLPLSELREAGGAAEHFLRVDQDAFSAVTVFHGSARIITYNDSHSRPRQASDIAHELAHALLLHPPQVALSAEGCRDWREEIEAEADWLAGVLLVPEEGALHIVRNEVSIQDAATHYGVSVDMVKFRINVTGARNRVHRSKRRDAPGGRLGARGRGHRAKE